MSARDRSNAVEEVINHGDPEAPLDARDATIARLEQRIERLEQSNRMGLAETAILHPIKHAFLPGIGNKVEAAGSLAWRGLAAYGIYRGIKALVGYFTKKSPVPVAEVIPEPEMLE